MIQRLELWPILSSKNQNKCGKVERSMITNIFVATTFSGCNIKVYDLGINVLPFLEGRNERPNILESCTSY